MEAIAPAEEESHSRISLADGLPNALNGCSSLSEQGPRGCDKLARGMASIQRIGCACTLIFLLSNAAPAQSAGPWHYRLQTGDHLIYSEVIDRTIEGDESFHMRIAFTNHVLVAGERNGIFAVGMQRNRDSAELLSYQGPNKLEAQRKQFQQQVAKRSPSFAEANTFNHLGQAQGPWQAVRESSGRMLFTVHEIESLPEQAVAPGGQWRSTSVLAMDFKFAGLQDRGGEKCARLGAKQHNLRLEYWFCPKQGAITRLEFDVRYSSFAGEVHELITFELKARSSGESLSTWLANKQTRYGALRALLSAPWVRISQDQLSDLLAGEPETQALALTLAFHRRLPLESGLKAKLAASQDPLVRKLATAEPNSAKAAAVAPGTWWYSQTDEPYRGAPYIVRLPETYDGTKPFPVLVHLSGGPGIAIDAANTSEAALTGTQFLVVYPDAGGRMWWEPEVTQQVDALLRELPKHFDIDSRRIVMSGFSNGGTGSFHYATVWPERFRGIVSLMGAGVCMLPESSKTLSRLSSLPILLAHGDQDPIVPTHCSEDTYKALKKAGDNQVELHILHGHGHDLTIGNDDGLTVNFAEEHLRQ